MAVSTAITTFNTSFQFSFTILIYNLTNYNLQFIYNLVILQFIYILADFVILSNAKNLAQVLC